MIRNNPHSIRAKVTGLGGVRESFNSEVFSIEVI